MVIKIKFKQMISILLVLAIITAVPVIIGNFHSAKASTLNNNSLYIPIIMYHEVKAYKLGKDVISPFEFENDLKYLSKNNFNTITMSQLIAYVDQGKSLPTNPIMLTFDDGYLNNYNYVLPLLKKYKMSIVFSIIGKNTDDFTDTPDNNLDYSHVTWDQLKEMIDSGFVEVQNHTYNLHATVNGRIGCMKKYNESNLDYEEVLIGDTLKLQSEVKSHTGKEPNTFVYPYGKSSESTDAIIKKLGFKASLSCKYGVNKITEDPECLFGLKRICRSHGDVLKKVLSEADKTIRK